jgi:hypothetical protein
MARQRSPGFGVALSSSSARERLPVVYAGSLPQYASSPLAAYVTGLDGGGFITVANLMADANAALGDSAADMTTYGDAFRILLLNLATDLLNAYNNTSFAG